MACSDLPNWYLRRRIAVINLHSETWRAAKTEVVPAGYKPAECLARLGKAGRVRRVGVGLFVVVDPIRETPAIAVSSELFADEPHYVTTDAALAFHGLIDQPTRRIVVALSRTRRPIDIGSAVVRPVKLRADRLLSADSYETTADGFKVRLATREQAVVDGVAEPKWMVNHDLLSEVLGSFSDEEIKRTTVLALSRSMAAAQRLGYLLEDARRAIPDTLAKIRPVRAVRLWPSLKGKRQYSTRWRVYG